MKKRRKRSIPSDCIYDKQENKLYPRKPLSSYQFFIEDLKTQPIEDGKKLTLKQLSQIGKKRWKEFSEEEKSCFEKQHENDTKRYKSQLAELERDGYFTLSCGAKSNDSAYIDDGEETKNNKKRSKTPVENPERKRNVKVPSKTEETKDEKPKEKIKSEDNAASKKVFVYLCGSWGYKRNSERVAKSLINNLDLKSDQVIVQSRKSREIDVQVQIGSEKNDVYHKSSTYLTLTDLIEAVKPYFP
ncbi:unnamed protein product [Blepharisma stoltei]|uniref:HMG box domain-containing protein n=1 Tax=Blepharisma stoltei TaxID=1481888 RepID=A0AAU9JEG9_9CILI|nr:unnamed protein product [Blepharisma stoltei]